jgi:hypothetical protein
MGGLLTVPWIGTTGAISQVCYPVGNAPWPTNPASPGQNPVNAQIVVQGQTTQNQTQAEWTAVFGNYINSGQPNGQKVTVYSGAVQGPLGGSAWSLNTLIVRNGIPSNAPGGPGNVGSSAPGTPGAIPTPNSTIGYELDFTNWDQDCSPGVGAFTVGMFISAVSTYKSLAGIYFGGQTLTAGKHLWHHGIMFADIAQTGMNIERSTIIDGSRAAVSYEDGGTHSACSYYANDTSPVAIQINGNHSSADILITDNAPGVLHVNGSHTNVVDLSGATISGVAWNGAFSATSIQNTPVGSTTAAAGAFTTLSATGAVSGAGFTSLLAPYAPLASPTFTGTPVAPTAAVGTNTTQLATTAYVRAVFAAPPAIGGTTPAPGAFTSLSATGQINGALLTGGGTVGSVGTTGGDAGHCGFLAFYDASATRLGYIGYAPTGGIIDLECENGTAGYRVLSGSFTVPGANGIIVGTPTIRSGTGAATGTQPKGSLWLRTDGAVGSTLYVTQGGGTWAAVAGV